MAQEELVAASVFLLAAEVPVGLMSVTSLLAELHGEAFRALCSASGRSHEGLTVAARAAKKLRIISGLTAKRMERIDIAFHMVCHVNEHKVADCLGDLRSEITSARNHVPPASTASSRSTSASDSGVVAGTAESLVVESCSDEDDAALPRRKNKSVAGHEQERLRKEAEARAQKEAEEQAQRARREAEEIAQNEVNELARKKLRLRSVLERRRKIGRGKRFKNGSERRPRN